MKNTKTKSLSLNFVWGIRSKLRAEGDKLYAEGDKLRAEGDKLYAEGSKLRAEGDKLYAEGDKLYAEGIKLRAEGDTIWIGAILELYGNIKLEWKNWNQEKNSYECYLENGEVFKP